MTKCFWKLIYFSFSPLLIFSTFYSCSFFFTFYFFLLSSVNIFHFLFLFFFHVLFFSFSPLLKFYFKVFAFLDIFYNLFGSLNSNLSQFFLFETSNLVEQANMISMLVMPFNQSSYEHFSILFCKLNYPVIVKLRVYMFSGETGKYIAK